jgi:hypothetical protein
MEQQNVLTTLEGMLAMWNDFATNAHEETGLPVIPQIDLVTEGEEEVLSLRRDREIELKQSHNRLYKRSNPLLDILTIVGRIILTVLGWAVGPVFIVAGLIMMLLSVAGGAVLGCGMCLVGGLTAAAMGCVSAGVGCAECLGRCCTCCMVGGWSGPVLNALFAPVRCIRDTAFKAIGCVIEGAILTSSAIAKVGFQLMGLGFYDYRAIARRAKLRVTGGPTGNLN